MRLDLTSTSPNLPFLLLMSQKRELTLLLKIGVYLPNFSLQPILVCLLGLSLELFYLSQTIEYNLKSLQKKLNNWKYAYISKRGRLTLIKSSLASLPTYQLLVFKAPISSWKKIEKYWRDFLWRNKYDDHCINANLKKRLNSIIWSSATALEEKRGFGISPIAETNYALLTKWLWRYHLEPKALWRTFIDAKYSNHW